MRDNESNSLSEWQVRAERLPGQVMAVNAPRKRISLSIKALQNA